MVPFGTYTLAVRATNDAGTNAASGSVSITFPGTCAGAPGIPVGFIMYRLGSTIYVLSDPAPSGPATTGYVVTVSGSLNASFPGHITGDQPNRRAREHTPLTVTGTNAYRHIVVTLSADGDGASSTGNSEWHG